MGGLRRARASGNVSPGCISGCAAGCILPWTMLLSGTGTGNEFIIQGLHSAAHKPQWITAGMVAGQEITAASCAVIKYSPLLAGTATANTSKRWFLSSPLSRSESSPALLPPLSVQNFFFFKKWLKPCVTSVVTTPAVRQQLWDAWIAQSNLLGQLGTKIWERLM